MKNRVDCHLFGKYWALVSVSALLLVVCVARASAELNLTDLVPRQGDTVEIFYSPQKPLVKNPEAKFKDKTVKLFLDPASGDGKRKQSWEGLLAIPADLQPGLYSVHVSGEDAVFRVQDAQFHVQQISLPKAKDNFLTSPDEEETMDKTKAILSDTRLWTGKFIAPSDARKSARFGLRRMVNGKLLKDYYHTGLDFAGSLGSPVKATQAGKVVLAHEGFRLHGNVVAIDHGQGVLSIYIHLKSIAVKVGDVVKVGQVIGAVGQTGRANGPHLHFSMYVNGTATNPELWLSRTF